MISVKSVQLKILEFRRAVDNAHNAEELIAAKRVLELYLRAIEKKILDLPMSPMSQRIIENEHRITYKYE